MALFSWFGPTRREFPNALASASPITGAPPRAGWLIAALVLACLIPRVWMAWRVDILTEDGPVYIAAATYLEQGDFQAAFRRTNLGLNLYPVILMGLHRAGLDYELAGRLWGTLMATLVVLPLFGWVRRQFDDRVAALCCLLYATHASLIERSPEMLRCPTFWFLLICTLHYSWRAVTEVSIRHFLVAGACFALGVYTRFEAWLCLVPWTLWTAWRFRFLQVSRGRLLAGCLLGLAVMPAATAVVNLTWLRHEPHWEWCLTQRIAVLTQLLKARSEAAAQAAAANAAQPAATEAAPSTPIPAPAPAPPPPVETPSQLAESGHLAFGTHGSPVQRREVPPWKFAWAYIKKLVDAVDPVYGLFLLLGLAYWRRVFFRCDHQAIFCFNVGCLALVLAFWDLAQGLQGRYFFPVLLTAVPWTAGGWFCLLDGLSRLAGTLHFDRQRWSSAVAMGFFLVVCVYGCADALTNNYDDRRERRLLAGWILETLGPHQVILSPEPGSMALAYYAQSWQHPFPPELVAAGQFVDTVHAVSPSVITIPLHNSPVERAFWLQCFETHEPLRTQFKVVPQEMLPDGVQSTLVLLRTPAWERTARKTR